MSRIIKLAQSRGLLFLRMNANLFYALSLSVLGENGEIGCDPHVIKRGRQLMVHHLLRQLNEFYYHNKGN